MRMAYQAQREGWLDKMPQTGLENSWRYQNGQRIETEELEEDLPDGVSFLYSGSLRPLNAALAALELTDMTITEPDLEEIFLHYYADPAPTKGDLAL